MKNILFFFVFVISSSLHLYGQGVYEEFNPSFLNLDFTHTEITTGAYYDGCAWLFYPWGEIIFGTRISYLKIKINQDGTKEMLADSSGKKNWKFPFVVKDSRTGMCAQVFNGMLYLFVTDKDDKIMYLRTDGENWSEPAFMGDITAKGKNMASAVMNGKMYLLKQNVNGGIKLLESSDGETWITKKIIYYNSDDVSTSSLALTSFIKDAKEHLVIGINRWNDAVETICWDNDNGLYNAITIPEAVGKGISMVTGRVNYGSDLELLPVQCIIKGTDGKIWIATYNPENNTWLNLHKIAEYPSDRYYQSIPSAFSNFRYKSNGTVVKQLWVGTLSIDTNGGYNLGVYNVKSEELRKTKTVSTNCDDAPSLWTLIGVVEGPPPYVLNGSSFADLDDPISSFTYGTQESNEIVNSIESKISTSVSMTVPLLEGILTCGFDMTAALSDFQSTTFSTSYTVAKSVVSGEYSLGYYYFMKPTITRFKYESFTPSGQNTGEYQYVFSVTGASLISVDFPLTNFDPNDITTYLNKVPDQSYSRISEKGFQWSVQSPWESEFSMTTATEQTFSSSIGIGVSMGIPEILDVNVNYDLTLSETHTTSFGKSITILLDNPNPRSGNTNDVKSYSGVAYWLKAPNKNAYWIPKDFEGHDFSNQRPWCITWSVGDISYNDLTDVNEEKNLPTEYELSQNFPNPFNPTTMINYGIPEEANVKIEIFNMLGQRVDVLVNSEKSTGFYEENWNASNLPSGIYLVSIKANGINSGQNFVQVKKAILLK